VTSIGLPFLPGSTNSEDDFFERAASISHTRAVRLTVRRALVVFPSGCEDSRISRSERVSCERQNTNESIRTLAQGALLQLVVLICRSARSIQRIMAKSDLPRGPWIWSF
jgi:hypothetical protein